jgi:hypothetical protein
MQSLRQLVGRCRLDVSTAYGPATVRRPMRQMHAARQREICRENIFLAPLNARSWDTTPGEGPTCRPTSYPVFRGRTRETGAYGRLLASGGRGGEIFFLNVAA